MPKRSRSRTRKRTKQSGGDEETAVPVNVQGNEEDGEGEELNLTEVDDPVTSGGKRGKTSRKGKKRMKKTRKGKKKMNEFFKLLIKAKKSGAPSFVYKGKTYKRKVGTKKNPKLVVYKKA
tara:strand:+ start:1035 stop:1394 length:360 start_codon:yes stop_codon:yes gene_type:complete